jgi:uncharacterized protein involved in exopolysaccharide biosynthesis
MEDKTITRQQTPSISLRDLLTILFKHKYMIVSVFLISVIAATIIAFLLPPVYVARAVLLIRFGREYIYRSEVGNQPPVVSYNPEGVINSEITILTSRDLIEKVITALKVENIYPDLANNPSSKMEPMGAAILTFENSLRAEGVARSNVIEISFEHENPEIAARAVNQLVELFREKHLQVYSDSQSPFLETQAGTFGQKLKESENRLEAFKQRKQVFSIDEQGSLLLKQRADLDTSLKSSENRVDELKTKLSSLKAQLKVIPETKNLDTQEVQPEAGESITVGQAKAQLLSLQLKERELLEKYKENNRLVVNVRRDIEMVKEFLRQQEKQGVGATGGKGKTQIENVVYQEVQKDMLKTEADLSAELGKVPLLRRQLRETEREIQDLDFKAKELQTLKREAASDEKNYQTYLDKLEEARISEDMNRQKMANITVIQEATVPLRPEKSDKRKIVLMGLLLGACLGIGSAFFFEYAKQGLSTPESAEKRLGLPVLSTFPYKK